MCVAHRNQQSANVWLARIRIWYETWWIHGIGSAGHSKFATPYCVATLQQSYTGVGSESEMMWNHSASIMSSHNSTTKYTKEKTITPKHTKAHKNSTAAGVAWKPFSLHEHTGSLSSFLPRSDDRYSCFYFNALLLLCLCVFMCVTMCFCMLLCACCFFFLLLCAW